ncbi:MAG: TonB-dependent receptor [Gemmatimonadaceae bacterium]|nr:TonB-dependent receptor [Chitinophagaceae bacterium]
MRNVRSSRICCGAISAAIFALLCVWAPISAKAAGAPEIKVPFFDKTVTGVVRDASGKPLAGATVTVKGNTKSTVTDENGAFTITVPDNTSVLVVSYSGFTVQEIDIVNKSIVEISMATNVTELNQVVVVGYGTQSRRDVTGSVKSIKSESFNKGIVNTPQELLQGKVSGVNVTSASGEPGGILGITVRGPGGIRTSNTPLFVIDGLALDNSSTGGGDPLNFLNPQDIESIDVLKDASATAIYGARGANGVILITTKRGKAGVSIMSFTTSIGISKIARALDVLTADEFRAEVPKLGAVIDDKGGNTDWQKEVTRSALTQNYNLNMSGGANKLTYYASFGMQKQQGIIKSNSHDRYSGRFNVTQRFLDDRLTVEANLSVANTKNYRPPVQSIIAEVISNNPTYPAYDANGKPAQYQGINNPLIYFDLDKDITTINRVIGNISPSLKLFKGLVYKLNFGVDNSNGTRDLQALPNAVPFREGRLDTWTTQNRNTLIENYLTYNWTNDVHNISALAGHSYQEVFLQGRNNSINRFPIGPVEPIFNPGLGQDLTLANNKPGGYARINELQSFFGRITYQYNKKYLMTANFRADGSTKFGANNKYGYFPSFSVGWKISEEDFMKNSAFYNLKLRAGWGMTGNQEIPSKQSLASFNTVVSGSTSYPLTLTGAYPAGTVFARLANPDIQWEVSKQTDIGVDFAFLNGALSGTIDYFNKISNNILLVIPPADPVQPAPITWDNIESMKIINKGFEFELDYRHQSKTGLSYNVGGNLTLIDNKVTNSPYTVLTSGSASGSGLTSATINGYVNDEPIGTFYLKEFTGFDANGVSTFRDTDKDGIISDKDRIAAGTALPNKMYNFYGGVGFKGFDLNVSFNGVAGNKVYDNTANSNFYKLKLSKNVNVTRKAIEDAKESVNNSAPVSTRYLKNGAYLRLNNLNLGYSFNPSQLGIGKWVSALRLSVTGQNLFLITEYDGYDPEVNTDRSDSEFNALSYGIDYLSYPKARSVIFNLNISF